MASAAAKKVLVCVHQRMTAANPSCGGRGSQQILDLLRQAIAAQSLNIAVERFICFGMCTRGPNVRLAPGGAFFHHVTPERIPEIVQAIRQFLEAGSG